MSHSRKHLRDAQLNSFPIPTEDEKIARVTELRGANICEIEYKPNGEKSLAQIPSKFRKLIWIKRGKNIKPSRGTI